MSAFLLGFLLAIPFDWHQLFGTYHFQECHNEGGAIWQTDPAHQYILISDDPFNTQEVPPHYFAAALVHEPFTSIVPIWEFADVDQGPVEVRDEQTHVVKQRHVNETLADGARSLMEWNFGEDHGSAAFSLRKVGDAELVYEMERHDALSGTERHETCRLVKE